MQVLTTEIDFQQYEEDWSELLKQARCATDASEFLNLCRRHQRLKAKAPRSYAKTVKVALLGGVSTEMIEGPLKLATEAKGLECKIYRSEYNTLAAEMLDERSDAVKFKPDVAVIVTAATNLPAWPVVGDHLKRVCELADEVCEYWLGLCERLHELTGCEIILNNFHQLPLRPLGNIGAKLPWDANNFLRRVNLELGTRAPAYVHINDVEALAAQHGVRQWFDARYWFHAKLPISFQCLLPYIRNTAGIIGALFGHTAKCLVLDLDNTLWGGVVGDDGFDGIIFGEGDAVGEAYKAFQDYLLALKRRGVLLAVCSKNDEANARAPFVHRPEMVLKLDDFVSFKANWRSKPDNLRQIALELNIGLDSLVFVDDNRVERDHVRQRLPEVNVVELSEDPSDYPQLLDDAGMFEITTFSREDQQRTHQYHENTKREAVRETAADYASYLRTLEQKAVIRPFVAVDLDRITQLVNKSNQFNLTTLRLTRTQVEDLMYDSEVLTATVRLRDKFGDNGLIAVVFARAEHDALRIEEWLMSCRVLKRGVEQLLCNHLVGQARLRGFKALLGSYVPTAKNSLVRDHYHALGFSQVDSEDAAGVSHWRLDLNTYPPFEVPIEIVEVNYHG